MASPVLGKATPQLVVPIDFENETGEVIKKEHGIKKLCVPRYVADLQPSAPCRASMVAEEVRNEFKLHFNGPGYTNENFKGNI